MVPLEFRRGIPLKLKQSGVKRDYNALSGQVFAFYRIAQDVQLGEKRDGMPTALRYSMSFCVTRRDRMHSGLDSIPVKEMLRVCYEANRWIKRVVTERFSYNSIIPTVPPVFISNNILLFRPSHGLLSFAKVNYFFITAGLFSRPSYTVKRSYEQITSPVLMENSLWVANDLRQAA